MAERYYPVATARKGILVDSVLSERVRFINAGDDEWHEGHCFLEFYGLDSLALTWQKLQRVTVAGLNRQSKSGVSLR